MSKIAESILGVLPKTSGGKSDAEKLLLEGIKQHDCFLDAFRKAKESAFTAGVFFAAAHDRCKHGEWLPLANAYVRHISLRTIQRYIEFAEEVVLWVRAARPELASEPMGTPKLKAAALEMIMQSPKSFVSLCRDLRLMRKFGEYDEIKYRTRQIRGEGQIEFDFSALAKSIEPFARLGDPNVTIKFPDGADAVEELRKLETDLAIALTKVRSELTAKTTVDA